MDRKQSAVGRCPERLYDAIGREFTHLHEGERKAILLGEEFRVDLLIVDDQAGWEVATARLWKRMRDRHQARMKDGDNRER